MKGYLVEADFAPKKEYELSEREKNTKRAQKGNMVWKNVRGTYREDLEMPVLKDDEVLVRVGVCGVCGSDVHIMQTDDEGYTHFGGHSRFPAVIGHEFSGEIVEAGKNTRKFKVGDLVSCESMQACGLCDACLMDKPNQCNNLEEGGITVNGGFGEYVAIKERYCWSLNDILKQTGDKTKTLELGALVEPMGIAYHGICVEAKGIHAGGDVAVFGAGPIGLSSIAIAKATGAGKIFAVEGLAKRKEIAKEMGADYVLDFNELKKEGKTIGQKIMELTDGKGVSTVIEAVGLQSVTYPDIERIIRPGAKVVQLGLGSSRASVDLSVFQFKGAQIYGSIGHGGHGIFYSVISLIANGRVDPMKMVTARMPLEKTHDAITKLGSSPEHGKVLVSTLYK